MKYNIFAFSFALLFSVVALGQTVGPVFVEDLSKNTGLITFTDKKSKGFYGGTGTIIAKMTDSIRGRIYLVTCKHVLPKFSQSDHLIFSIRKDSGSLSSFINLHIPLYDSRGALLKTVRVNPSGYDVAAIDITSFGSHLMYLNGHFITSNFLMDSSRLETSVLFSVGKEVLFVGYPNFFFNRKNVSPVLRTGVIATPPGERFYLNDTVRVIHYKRTGELLSEDFGGFLVDGNVFGGSSGSLVFTKPVNVVGEPGGVGVSAVPLSGIIGMISLSYFSISDTQRLNLAGVISSFAIIKTLDQFK